MCISTINEFPDHSKVKKEVSLPLVGRWWHQVAVKSRQQGFGLHRPPPRLGKRAQLSSVTRGLIGHRCKKHVYIGESEANWIYTGPRPHRSSADPDSAARIRWEGEKEQACHLSHVTPSSLVCIIYGVIWAVSNLIKGHSKLTNRFKWTEAINAHRSPWKQLGSAWSWADQEQPVAGERWIAGGEGEGGT